MKMHDSLLRDARWLFLPLVFSIGACAPADDDGMADGEVQNVDDTMDAGTALTALTDEYVRHYNLGHPDQVTALYTADAVVLAADGSIAMGPDAIRAFNAAQMAGGSPQLQATVLHDKVFGDTAVVVGSYTVTSTPEGEEPVEVSGHWMAADVRTPDGWKIAGLITNHDRQMSAEFLQGTVPAEPMPAESTMGAMLRAYEQAWNAGDAAGVAGMYTENAWAAFADLPAVSGRETIGSLMTERVRGTLALTGVRSVDLGGGYTIDGGWYEVSGVEGGPIRGNYWVLVNTNDAGERKIEWAVTNGRPVSVIPEPAAM